MNSVRALIVDDSSVMRKIVERSLRQAGIDLKQVFEAGNGAEALAVLQDNGVDLIPIHLHSYYRDKYGFRPKDFPVAYTEYQRMVSLPCSPRMSEQDVDDVIDAVTEVLQKYRQPDRMAQLASALTAGGRA